MLDTAADSSTYGHTHRRHQHLGHFHNEDDSPEEAVGNTSARPRSETQLKKKSGEEVDDDDGEHGGEQSSRQNELEDDNNENSTKTSNATAIPNTSAEKSTVNSTSPPDTTEDEGKVTTVSPTESSEEERDGNFEEKKARAAEEEEDWELRRDWMQIHIMVPQTFFQFRMFTLTKKKGSYWIDFLKLSKVRELIKILVNFLCISFHGW